MFKCEEWIVEVEKCEEEGVVIICSNIIEEIFGWGLDEDDDCKEFWMEDVKVSISCEKYVIVWVIYVYVFCVFFNSKSFYFVVVDLEREYGNKEDFWNVFEKVVEVCFY